MSITRTGVSPAVPTPGADESTPEQENSWGSRNAVDWVRLPSGSPSRIKGLQGTLDHIGLAADTSPSSHADNLNLRGIITPTATAHRSANTRDESGCEAETKAILAI